MKSKNEKLMDKKKKLVEKLSKLDNELEEQMILQLLGPTPEWDLSELQKLLTNREILRTLKVLVYSAKKIPNKKKKT